ncbi:unnamed protein product, partial [Didymodactylos carnosus]
MRRFLVWPSEMIWPYNLPYIALLRTMYEKDHSFEPKWLKLDRMRFFLVVCTISAIYYWLPGLIFPLLTAFSWMCMLYPNNVLLAQLTGTDGLAMGGGTLIFDWLTLTSQLGSPILTPHWAQINILIGFVLVCWLFIPIMYYTNVWNFMTFPIADSRFFYSNGSVFRLPGNSEQGAAIPPIEENFFEIYNNNTRPCFYSTATFVIGNYLFFASLAALITHTIFYYGKDILKYAKTSLQHRQNDIHCVLMSKYSEAPQWLYWIAAIIGFVSGCFICHY